MEENENKNREEIYTASVRAGKRTYFFDVKATKRNDYYVTITESKKRFSRDGSHFYEKHKIFLYKEDFEKFIEGYKNVIDYIQENQPPRIESNEEEAPENEYSNIEFDDLEN